MARGHGSAVSDRAQRAVEAVWRIESARVVGALARYTGDLALAEDVAQEALAEALVAWRDQVPANPVGWLLTTARRRAIDMFRRRSALDERYVALAHGLAEGEATSGGDTPPSGSDVLWDPDAIDDDVLALMFTACHPALSREAQIALTLRVVGGLTSEEIARAFLVPVPTVQARITRAKKTLAAARAGFGVPDAAERPERLAAVRHVIYVIFTEGSSATSGDDWIRHDLASEAVRLARVLTRLVPELYTSLPRGSGSRNAGGSHEIAETYGLLALLELTAARFPARVDQAGRPVLLEHQDRRRWDRQAIRRGRAALARAVADGRGLGAYGLQAAIAEQHAVATSVAETDWDRIVLLYEALGRLAPSPVVELNRAVAVAMAFGPAAGLALVDRIQALPAVYHALPAVRGELLARLGRAAEAREAFLKAAGLCGNAAERAVLEEKAAGLA